MSNLFELSAVREENSVINIDDFRDGIGQRIKNAKHRGHTSLDFDKELAFASEQLNGGGGGGMNDILRRIESLEQGQKDLREELKNDLKDKASKTDVANAILDLKLYIKENVPNEDRIKTIFSEQLKSHGVATETYVKAQINESNATLMKWIVGIGISAIVSIGLALIRYFTH